MRITKENIDSEVEEIQRRYERRKKLHPGYYSSLNPEIYMSEQEKERVFIRWIKSARLLPLENKKLIEIGAGNGKNIIQFLKLGFSSENMAANELLSERIAVLRRKIPSNVTILEGNALELNLERESFDIVFQSMVFSSILNKDFQFELAEKMWEWVKPGGGILWYDFTFNNPRNKDVAGIPFKIVKDLFPSGKIKKWKLTLAPPLSRFVTKAGPGFYTLFNFFPFLRTHILCWIRKHA